MRKEEFRIIPVVYGGKGTHNSRIFLIIGKEPVIIPLILFPLRVSVPLLLYPSGKRRI